MTIKVFMVDDHGYSLHGDERCVMVPRIYKYEVLDWCAENGITATVSSSDLSESAFKVNLWRVEDEGQRLVFLLRWG
jgi:hypothetical protein